MILQNRALSSGRFFASKEINLDDLNSVDEGNISFFTSTYLTNSYAEFLFRHEHWHVKKHGVDCLFSALKNIKYQKYLSRPHVGNKLQVNSHLQICQTIALTVETGNKRITRS